MKCIICQLIHQLENIQKLFVCKSFVNVVIKCQRPFYFISIVLFLFVCLFSVTCYIYTVREKRVFIKHFGDVSLIRCSPTVPSYYKNWIELRIEGEWEKMKKRHIWYLFGLYKMKMQASGNLVLYHLQSTLNVVHKFNFFQKIKLIRWNLKVSRWVWSLNRSS